MSTQSEQAIGVFDSGLGGLTVLHAIMQRLPNEHTVYFGDTGRTPYGSKSPETIIRFSQQNSRFLLEQGVKMIVIACNTASAHAFKAVCDQVNVPVVEVVTPGAEAAVVATRNQRIGVIGTKGTVNSGVYVRAIEAAAARIGTPRPIEIVQQAFPLFVGLAEEGWWDNDIARRIAAEYLRPLQDAMIDTLVLGCTHYPLLTPVIAQVMGPDVTLINAGSKVAAQVEAVLSASGLLNQSGEPGRHTFFTSDSAEQFQQLGSAFLDQPVTAAGSINIERY
jgi:glutamate racemase